MNRQANILFNINSSVSDIWLALQDSTAPQSYYQRLLYSLLARNLYKTENFQVLGRQLAAFARQACLNRQMEVVEQASQLMFALPISKELKGIAHYYQAICVKRKGDFDNARRLLEHVVEEATSQYRARALLTIGATYYERGKVDAALPFYLASGRAAGRRDLLTLAESQQMIAVVRSVHGDHKEALESLEKLLPLASTISKHYPALYYSFLNSIAIELGEVGRLDEANAACAIALASPFASAYPEFPATRDELEAKRTAATPSVVAIPRALEPAPEPQVQAARQPKPVCTLALRWLARKNSVLQTSMVIAPAIPLIESIPTVRDRVRCCIQPRGPPPFSHRSFGILPQSPRLTFMLTRWPEPLPSISSVFAAPFQPALAASRGGASSSHHTFACCAWLPSRHHRESSVWFLYYPARLFSAVFFRLVNYLGELLKVGINWAGGCGHNCLPHLTARLGGQEITPVHLCVQKGKL